jgi:hypothetical protein
MRLPEAVMANRHRGEWLWYLVAGAFVLAGLRDIFWPGFLSVSGRSGGSKRENLEQFLACMW